MQDVELYQRILSFGANKCVRNRFTQDGSCHSFNFDTVPLLTKVLADG